MNNTYMMLYVLSEKSPELDAAMFLLGCGVLIFMVIGGLVLVAELVLRLLKRRVK